MSNALELIQDQEAQKVVLWDMGPPEPGPKPKPPVPPKGVPGEAAYDLAMVDFEPALDAYKEAIRAHAEAIKAHDRFKQQWGGPYEMHGVFSCDAREHMHNGRCRVCRDCKDWEARKHTGRVGPYASCSNSRYRVSSSTRGRKDLANLGLPDGVRPGHGHFSNMERIAAGEDDALRMRRSDPVFGQEELRQ